MYTATHVSAFCIDLNAYFVLQKRFRKFRVLSFSALSCNCNPTIRSQNEMFNLTIQLCPLKKRK